MFNTNQQQIFQQIKAKILHLTEQQIFDSAKNKHAKTLSTSELIEFLQVSNALYRSGEPLISDADYDFIFLAELKNREPQHELINQVEPEPPTAQKTVILPEKMLSTEKAYHLEDIKRWLKRIEKSALSLNKSVDKLVFRVTPKLDGYAAYDDGQTLYTRGDGTKGTDITRAVTRGLQVANQGKRGLGAGEIVISKTYFKEKLAEQFDNSRNFQASIIKEKALSPHAELAIKSGAAVFFPFRLLPDWQGDSVSLLKNFDCISNDIWHQTDYDVDGIVLEVTDTDIKQAMGATRHHHRWQIAYKENRATAEVKVLRVTPQTSRSGRITPVAELEPVRLSGALLQRATVHHYKMVLDKGIGEGAIIELARSGEVIPKIEKVLKSVVPQIPKTCPSCEHDLIWEGDFLMCTNHLTCSAQLTNTMEYFFKTLGNNDGLGSATISKLYDHNINTIADIYALKADEFEAFGFGAKQSSNLVEQLLRSRTEIIEDWRFLAAFGIFRMGRGNCEKLLTHYSLLDLFTLTEQDIIRVEGFAEKTATVVIQELVKIKPLFDIIYGLNFSLQRSEIVTVIEGESLVLAGKTVVFTGAMQQGSRDEMKKQAKALGAKVGSTVTGKTDWLIVGEKVGASKLKAAEEKGVIILTEAVYLEQLEN
ncbi:MAG: BRCT domain-containing protein [Methylococcales bacterium]|nr:BRCT domain-containing protein [Methylococcales bacterium]